MFRVKRGLAEGDERGLRKTTGRWEKRERERFRGENNKDKKHRLKEELSLVLQEPHTGSEEVLKVQILQRIVVI